MMRTATNVTGQILVPVLVAKEERILDQAIYDGAVEAREPATEAVLVAAE
jgi:Na+/H+-dicarboxylate symporter